MSAILISDVVADIGANKYNPTRVVGSVISAMEKALDGKVTIMDATSPFVAAVESAVCTLSSFMQENALNTASLYPRMAQTQDDLYKHMSDTDYVGLFATPSAAEFYLFFSKDEIINSVVRVPDSNYSQLCVPRNSVLRVSEIPFSIEYPILIKVFDHGGFQIVYDTSKETPLLSLNSNTIEHGFTSSSSGELLYFKVKARQFEIESITTTVGKSTGHRTDISLTDYFYYCRCYRLATDGQWVELKTTHSKQVYDINDPTIVLDVRQDEKKLTAIVPPIYTNTSALSGKLRFDLYQTKGALAMELGSYTTEDYVADWIAIDRNDENRYVNAFRSLSQFSVLSNSSVNGGNNSISFTELKEKVISNSVGMQQLPITNAQMVSSMQDLGFDVVKNLDTITNRIFLASKPMPNPSSDQILTPASSAMLQISTTLKELEFAYGAYVNGDIVTLSSKCLYETVDGITKPISLDKMRSLKNLSILDRCAVVSQSSYYYSPFTYVLDSTETTFGFRPYYIDNPQRVRKNFIKENTSSGYQVALSADYSIIKSDNGYTIRVLTDSNISYQALQDDQVAAQMIIYPVSQDAPVYVPGALKYKTDNGERLFEFELLSSWLIDSNDHLEISGTYSTTQAQRVSVNLEHDFEIYFTSNGPVASTFRNSEMDSEIFVSALPVNSFAISHERIRLNFGQSLDNLWAQARSALASTVYKVYSNDIPAVYEADVYEVDPATGLGFKIGSDGQLVYNKIANKGDLKVDSKGNTIYAHLKGEQVLDEQNNPVPIDGYVRYLNRYIDVFAIEGVYYFTTDSISATYKQQIADAMLQWITVDIKSYDGYLLDNTRIYFYPRVNTGTIKLLSSSNMYINVPSEQKLHLKLYVSPMVYNDPVLRQSLAKASIKTISSKLDKQSVSVSEIESSLRDYYKNNVLDVVLLGFGGSLNLTQMTVVQDHTRLSLKKKLTALPDNTAFVEEDIEIEFIKHGTDA